MSCSMKIFLSFVMSAPFKGEKTVNTYDYEENTHDHFEQANNSSEDEPFTELTEIWAH